MRYRNDHDAGSWSEDKLYKIVSFKCTKCFSDSDSIHHIHNGSKTLLVPEIVAIIGEVRSYIKSRNTNKTTTNILTNNKDKSTTAFNKDFIVAAMVN